MFRLLIVGRTETIAKEVASWATSGETKGNFYEKQYNIGGRVMSIRALPLWIDQTGIKPVGDGLLLVARSAGDLQIIEPFIDKYRIMSIKFILYDGAPGQSDFEAKWLAQPLPKGASIQFVERLIEANNELVKRIANVFKNIDKNGKGMIELYEVRELARELEHDIDDIPDKVIAELSKKKNGMVALEDLVDWFKTGGNVNSSQIAAKVKSAIEDNPVIQSILQPLQAIKPFDPSDKLINFSFGIYANRFTAPGLALEISVMTRSNRLDAELQQYLGPVGLGNNEPFLGIAFECKNPNEACNRLKNIINSSVMLAKSLNPMANKYLPFFAFKYGVSGNKALMCIVASEKGADAIGPILSLMNSLSTIVAPNQFMNIVLSLATDLEKIATEDRYWYDLLFDGINLTMNGSIHPAINKYGNEIFPHTELGHMMPNSFLTGVALSASMNDIFNSSEGELEFDINQEIKNVIMESLDNSDLHIIIKQHREKGVEELRNFFSETPLAESIRAFFAEDVISFETFHYFAGLGAIKFNHKVPGLSTLLSL